MMNATTASQWKKSYNLLVLIGLLSFPSPLRAQSTAFTYQGQLSVAGQAANGRYDLTFALFKDSTGGSPAAGPLATNGVAISNGLFTVVLDFGTGIFRGTSYWLEIGVRRNGTGSFAQLSPRQALTPTPYAIYAAGADVAGLKGKILSSCLSGLYDEPVFFSNPNNSFSGDGNGLINLWPGNISPGTASIDISGNAATANYAKYTGTASNAPESQFALVVKGNQTNEGGIYINNPCGLTTGVSLGTDGGIWTGGYFALCGNSQIFEIPAAGQSMMLVGCDVPTGIVGYRGSPFLTLFDQVAGGYATSGNFPSGCNTFTIGAYGQVVLNNPSSQSCDIYEPKFESPQLVFQSEILTNLGKWGPTNYWGISQVSNVFTIGPMTRVNLHMNGAGAASFVEGSVLPAIVITTNGKVGIGTASPKHTLEVAGTVSATSFINSSDRNLKEGFREVDAQEVLEAVATLPIQRWHFRRDLQTQHIGPMAQDFHAAFEVGPDDKHIDTLDADGVALAAIQGLNHKLTEELKQKQTEITELRQRLDRLEQHLTEKSEGKGDSTDRDKKASRRR